MSSYRKHTRSLLLGATALVGSFALIATPAGAQERHYDFDVPAQPLESAVQAFARQAQQQVIFADTQMRGMKAPALNGSYSADEGLAILLAGTGLEVHRTASGVLKIAADADPQSSGAAGGGAEVEALIVTAQKREENIQDVPIAMSAFTQEDLTRSQVAGGPDLITQVPNMTFTKTNFSSYSVQLRGIGTQAISATTDPAVAIAFNNTPFIRNRFFEQEFYDLQRVEVLRGPQGTLYGRNATAGVVNIISQKPKFTFEAKASADVSNYSASRLEGMVNLPLVEDAVALRIAGAWTKRDGYATNELTGNPIDGRDLWSTRVSLRVSPSDRIDANLIWEHFEEGDDRLRSGKQLCKKDVVTHVGNLVIDDYFMNVPDRGQAGGISTVQSAFSQGCKRESLYSPDIFQTPNGQSIPYYFQLGAVGLPIGLKDPYVSEVQSPDLRVIESTIDPEYRANADIGEFQIKVDLPKGLTLYSETAYGTDGVYSLQDFNRFNTAPGAWGTESGIGQKAVMRGVLTEGPSGGIFCDPQLGCSDRLVAVDISTAQARQFSQEFRLASNFEGRFNFSLGANYLRADSEDKYYVFINSISLVAAMHGVVTNYVGGQTDNLDCLESGYRPGDPDGVYSVTGCVYIDPNPIGSVNDRGHNYFLSKNPYKLISYAVFGESYYDITDNLKITAGLRWTVDKKEAPRIPTWILASQSAGYPVAEVIEQEWREPTGRLTVDWKPDLAFTDETLLYGSFSHGYKAGGANPPGFVRVFYSQPEVARASAAGSATRPRTFEPEFVDAFEIGSKNTIADGLVTLNLAAFYYDYKDYQISEIVDRSAFNRNFDATIWGVELEADWKPLENLRLGFKGGYEDSRIADGERAVDLMDRTAGNEDWIVVRPFPTYASSCILPAGLYLPPGGSIAFGNSPIVGLGWVNGGGPGGCEYAYSFGYDPGTELPYGEPGGHGAASFWQPGTYPGFDPATAPNHGEGFDKPLGGNALPNAPHWTLTGTADYTIPLSNDWLVTLHTDLHWQSESYWRIFQDHEFSTLDEYFTMNLAAIFTNEERGWNVMAYVKNVTDETAISGAFLNSDDTGLTTNVFLTEPRLYGLRVTKAWNGGPLLGTSGKREVGPRPFTLEIGGQASRLDAPNAALDATHASAFAGPLDVLDAPQNEDLDWGDGRHVELTYKPNGGPWAIALGFRTVETNGLSTSFAEVTTPPVCVLGGPFSAFCNIPPEQVPAPLTSKSYFSKTNRADVSVRDREKYSIVDASMQRNVGFALLDHSLLGLGLRHAQMKSTTGIDLLGVPDWNIPVGLYPSLRATSTIYDIHVGAERSFEGAGPVLFWDASAPLLDWGEAGLLEIDWAAGAGVLFGQQETSIAETAKSTYVSSSALWTLFGGGAPPTTTVTEYPAVMMQRSSDATVPTVNAALGLSYTIGGFTAGAGYRWERYFDAIDGGYTKAQDADRTFDGPYFKIAVGFGG